MQLPRRAGTALTVIVVACALVGPVVVVRAHAVEKDNLRRAQVALAGFPGALEGVLQSPAALLAGAVPGPSEFPLSRRLRERLARPVGDVSRAWRTPTAVTLRREATLINTQTATLMGLIAQHRLREANALHDSSIQPLAQRFEAAIVRADAQLTREIRSADSTAWRATLGVLGVTGVLVMLLLSVLARARSRRLRTEIEHGVHRDSERRLQSLVEHGSDMIVVVEPDTTVKYQAGASESMLGYGPQAFLAAKLTDWVNDDDVQSLLTLCRSGRSSTREVRLRHRNGRELTCEVHATSLLDDPIWQGVVLNIWDLSERKALEERLRHQAFHDSLTGVANRALLTDRAEKMLARARRGAGSLAVLYLDVDGFKRVNDRFGHAAGDQLLQTVAERLLSAVREQDTVARLGGDEFVVLLEPGTTNAPPGQVAARLLSSLQRPIELSDSGRLVSLTVSIGLALGRRESVAEVLRAADRALYEAKRAGGGCWVPFAVGMEAGMQDRLVAQA